MLHAELLGLNGDLTFLNHALTPFRKAPVYIRFVNTQSKALDYAAGGFHVAVTRGQSGGCGDAADSIPTGTAGKCKSPFGRQALGSEWAGVAAMYSNAYALIKSRFGSGSLQLLRDANAAADRVYGLENVPPPRDPLTGESEAPMAKPTMPTKRKVAVAGGILGLLGTFVGTVAAIQRRF